MQVIRFTLTDEESGKELDGIIEIGKQSLQIGLANHGTDGTEIAYGRPIAVEIYQDKARLLYWPDINDPGPQIITMDGALCPCEDGELRSQFDELWRTPRSPTALEPPTRTLARRPKEQA